MCYFEEEEQIKEVWVVKANDGSWYAFTKHNLALNYCQQHGGSFLQLTLDPVIEGMWTVNFELHGDTLKVFTNRTEMPYRHTPNLFISGEVGNWIVRVYAKSSEAAIEKAKELLRAKL